MQTVLPDPAVQPFASLSIELEAFSGMNNIRRSLGRNVGLWTGSAQTDKFAVIQPGATLSFTDPMKAFLAVSDGPLTVTVNSQASQMNAMLVCDAGATGTTTFQNAGSSVVNFHITYLVP